MKTHFKFNYTDTEELQPDIVVPVEFYINVEWNTEPERKNLITAIIEKVINKDEPIEFIFEFWFSDVKDIPDYYTINVGADDEQKCKHDHYETGFEWCEDEIAEYILLNEKQWELLND